MKLFFSNSKTQTSGTLLYRYVIEYVGPSDVVSLLPSSFHEWRLFSYGSLQSLQKASMFKVKL